MSLETDVSTLRQIPILSEFGDDHLRMLAFGAEQINYRAGDRLFTIGDRGEAGFLVLSGTIDLIGADGETVLRSCGPGMLIGERAMLTQLTRAATAIAKTDTRAIRIRRALLSRMFDEYPELAARVHRALAKRVATRAKSLTAIGQSLRQLDRSRDP